MKKVSLVALMAFAMIFTTEALAQKFSGLDKSPMDMAAYPTDYKIANKSIRVIYSRPQLKGRSLSELAPAGKVWRTGANEAAEIRFYADVVFGGKPIKAGTYSLFTIPGDKEWTVVLNKNLNQWGAYSYEESADVARVTVPSASDGGADMVMGWDKTRVAVPITMAKM